MKAIFLAVALASLALPATAQQGPAGVPGAHEIAATIAQELPPAPPPPAVQSQWRKRAESECADAKDVDKCVRRKMAASLCQSQPEAQRSACIEAERQKTECSKTSDPQRCAARKQAYRQCKGETGKALQLCMQNKAPALDCKKSSDPARCERFEKARVACKEKTGDEHKQCLRDTLVPKK